MDASRFFHATPAEHGGVRLTLRTRDVGTSFLPGSAGHHVTEIDQDGVARTRASRDQNNGTKVSQTIFVFGPPSPGQTYKFEQMDNGQIAVVMMSNPEDLIGNTIESGGVTKGQTMDRARYVASGRDSSASKLKSLNKIHKTHFHR